MKAFFVLICLMKALTCFSAEIDKPSLLLAEILGQYKNGKSLPAEFEKNLIQEIDFLQTKKNQAKSLVPRFQLLLANVVAKSMNPSFQLGSKGQIAFAALLKTTFENKSLPESTRCIRIFEASSRDLPIEKYKVFHDQFLKFSKDSQFLENHLIFYRPLIAYYMNIGDVANAAKLFQEGIGKLQKFPEVDLLYLDQAAYYSTKFESNYVLSIIKKMASKDKKSPNLFYAKMIEALAYARNGNFKDSKSSLSEAKVIAEYASAENIFKLTSLEVEHLENVKNVEAKQQVKNLKSLMPKVSESLNLRLAKMLYFTGSKEDSLNFLVEISQTKFEKFYFESVVLSATAIISKKLNRPLPAGLKAKIENFRKKVVFFQTSDALTLANIKIASLALEEPVEKFKTFLQKDKSLTFYESTKYKDSFVTALLEEK